MGLGDIQDPEAIQKAIAEFDEKGREAFLDEHGYGPAQTYFLVYKGKRYDSKAIVGVAHGYEHPDEGPLGSYDFNGGEATVKKKLESLGFTVEMVEDREDKPAFWWVNQGKTYDAERDGGFIWAPQQNKSGNELYHWRNVANVEEGDIIFHYCQGRIVAVSTASKGGYEAERPDELPDDAWENDGWRADLQYHELDEPIGLEQFSEKLQKEQSERGPLEEGGGVKQGYLFELKRNAAAALAKRIPVGALPAKVRDRLAPLVRQNWIFQCNPDYYDLEGLLENEDVVRWTVSQHTDEISAGDTVYLWKAGEEAGIYGVGELTSGPKEMEELPGNDTYRKNMPDEKSGSGIRAEVDIRRRLVENPILRDRLQQITPEMKIIQSPQCTNAEVTDAEAEVLQKLVEHPRWQDGRYDTLAQLMDAFAEDPEYPNAPGFSVKNSEHEVKAVLPEKIGPPLRAVVQGDEGAISQLVAVLRDHSDVQDSIHDLMGPMAYAPREDFQLTLENGDAGRMMGLLQDAFDKTDPLEKRAEDFRVQLAEYQKELAEAGQLGGKDPSDVQRDMNWVAVLYFSYDPDSYIPYKARDFNRFAEQWDFPIRTSSPGTKYSEHCDLARYLLAYSQLQNAVLEDLIDAHSFVWASESLDEAQGTDLPALLGPCSTRPDPERKKALIDEKGGYAAWWSFPVKKYLEQLKQRGGDLYISVNGKVTDRWHFEDVRTSRGNDGMECPWPDLALPGEAGRPRMGPTKDKICKTWLRVTNIEEFDPPIPLEQFENFEDGTDVNPNPNGFRYIRLSASGPFRGIYEYIEKKGFHFPEEAITNYLLCLKTKPFVILTGLSGTGKTKLCQLVAEYFAGGQTADESRWAFVPVRPDWMDNKGLLGFHNAITNRYEGGRLLRLLLEARDDVQEPYFAILDEMNLAKVEYYFSDFLSCLESSLSTKDDPEKIDLHDHVPEGNEQELHVQDDEGNKLTVPRKLRIPCNVYFSGTVNVDETTYMFSPKVLDRANTIEFNYVDLEGGRDTDSTFRLEDPDAFELGKWDRVTSFHWDKLQDQQPGVADRIKELHNLLKKTSDHFGYRVAFEMAAYILNAAECVGEDDEVLSTALDFQVMQKVLPKFHGTVNQIELPLTRLLGYCLDYRVEDEATDTSDIVPPQEDRRLDAQTLYWRKGEGDWQEAVLPRSAAKIHKMLGQLKTEGFASFIQ